MAEAPPPGARLQLLDLSEDLLLRIAVHLPFTERLQLSTVCRKIRQLCAGPSELWRAVDASLWSEPPQAEDVPSFAFSDQLFAYRRQAITAAAASSALLRPSPLTMNTAAQTCHHARPPAWPLTGAPVGTPARRWIAPRAAAVEELCLSIPNTAHVPSLAATLPSLLLPANSDSPLPLTKLSIAWEGGATLAFGPAGLPALRKLGFTGTRLGVPAGTAAPSGLTDFGATDGTLSGALDGPWLPPTTTALYASNAGLLRLPGVVNHLPNLRRQGSRVGRAAGLRTSPPAQHSAGSVLAMIRSLACVCLDSCTAVLHSCCRCCCAAAWCCIRMSAWAAGTTWTP